MLRVWLLFACACGRVGFDGNHADASTIDASPVTVRIGERPGDTSLGTTDTFLDPLMPDVPRGLEQGSQCDIPDVALFRWELPAQVSTVLGGEVHIGVTSDLLESGVVEVREMQLAWSEAEATWNDQRAGTPWPAPGATGSYGAPFGTFDGRTLYTDYAVAVPVDVLERWARGANFGIAITVTASGVNLSVHDEPDHPELRPELVLEYVP